MNLPLARTIILTDAGTMAYSEELAAYDGTPNGSVTPPPTPTPVSIAGTPPPTGQVGQPYSFAPAAAGGAGTKVYALASGTLLAGLSLNTSTGAITGTPTAAGTMTALSVRVTDDTGSVSTTPTTVTIAALTISYGLSADGPPSTGTPTPASVAVTGPATIVEGTNATTPASVTVTGLSSIAEGN